MSRILSTGGEGVCLSACWDTPPPGVDTTPPDQTPLEQTPAGADPPGADTPPREQTPPREADCSIRSTSGRYASYWNAFLYILLLNKDELTAQLGSLTLFIKISFKKSDKRLNFSAILKRVFGDMYVLKFDNAINYIWSKVPRPPNNSIYTLLSLVQR